MENGLQRRAPYSNDNYQVTVDAEKQQLKIAKRGQATIAFKATNLPKREPVSHMNNQRSTSPKSVFEQKEDYVSDATSTQFNF
jgi:hypothetical protein